MARERPGSCQPLSFMVLGVRCHAREMSVRKEERMKRSYERFLSLRVCWANVKHLSVGADVGNNLQQVLGSSSSLAS